jgi:hypothetical protein
VLSNSENAGSSRFGVERRGQMRHAVRGFALRHVIWGALFWMVNPPLLGFNLQNKRQLGSGMFRVYIYYSYIYIIIIYILHLVVYSSNFEVSSKWIQQAILDVPTPGLPSFA